jgi:hypothetical protein
MMKSYEKWDIKLNLGSLGFDAVSGETAEEWTAARPSAD